MSVIAAAVIGSAAVGVYSANKQGKAAQAAAGAQVEAADRGIEEQRRQFDAIQELLKPYVGAGTGALGQQQVLAGLQGPDAQRAAIEAISNSPELQALMKSGETGILQNASATGGLRGGNTQAALAQFRPALLSAAINDQYGRLGGLASMGLGAATQTGQFGQASTNNVTTLLGQQGAALAGGQLAKGQQYANYANAINGSIGLYAGLGGFGKTPPPPQITTVANGASFGAAPSGYSLGGGF